MKNAYTIENDVARVILPRRDGNHFTLLVDASDLPILNDIAGTLFASRNKASRTFYAAYHFTIDGRQRTGWLHRHLLQCPRGMVVDHRNHNGLDNRRQNIRVTTGTGNNLNRGPQPNTVSGIRGVHLHRKTGKWRAQIGFQGKVISLGLHPTLEAAKFAFDEKLAELEHAL